MADKSKDKDGKKVEDSPEIAEARARLEELEAKRDGKNLQEYPKMIELPGEPEKRIVVNSKEEEDQHRGEVVPAFDLTPEEQAAKAGAKAEADKEAAGAKSRLAGPEDESASDVKVKKASAKAEAEKPGVVSRVKAKIKGHK